MKQSSIMGIVLLVGAVSFGAAWTFLPTLQGSAQAVESAAAVPLERARRLLHQYDARLAYQATVVESLGSNGAALEEPDDLTDEGLDAYQEIHERLWTAFQPMQWGDRPIQARANYGAREQQMRQGVGDRRLILSQNDDLLREAKAAADEALATSSGDGSGRDLSEAHRLKAMILLYQGMAQSVRAMVAREEMVPIRMALASLADEARALSGSMALIEQSGINAGIESAKEQADEARRAVDEQRHILAGLDRSLADMRQRIVAHRTQREAAKAALDKLEERGLDFSLDDPAGVYATEYLELARQYRQANRQVQDLTKGYFPHARIDASGDYLTGRYVENGSPFNLTIERGLNYFEAERTIAFEVLGERERSLREWETVQTRLEDLRASFAAEESAAGRRLAALRGEVDEHLEALAEASTSAIDLEEAALGELEKSARAIRDAASAASRWVSDAQQKTQEIPPQSQDRSAYKPRSDDRWISGFSLAQAADARLARAWILLTRFTSATQNAEVLERVVAGFETDDEVVDIEREDAQAAREAGIEEVKLAMADLERAHREAEGHWTLVAQAGSTQYLLALFGDSSYVADTIETYRKAVENREGFPPAQKIVSRLRTLEGR